MLEIRKYGDQVLRANSLPVERVDENFVKEMLETLKESTGIGLAAPQVGVNLRLFVIDIENGENTITVDGQEVKEKDVMPLVCINPQLKAYGKSVALYEGCLSIPNIYSSITRPERVEVSFENLEGKRVKIDCGGLLARCFQHENDHLNGILYCDRASSASKIGLKKKIQKAFGKR